jgi:hypothetical protein
MILARVASPLVMMASFIKSSFDKKASARYYISKNVDGSQLFLDAIHPNPIAPSKAVGMETQITEAQ